MTKDARNPNDEGTEPRRYPKTSVSSVHPTLLALRASSFLRHLAFVIRHFCVLSAIALVSPALAQEVVGSFEFTAATAAYEVWGAGTQRRAFADELLPACFERTLALDELAADQPLQWIFTGPRAGITITVATNEVRLAHRFYDSPGFFEVAGKAARHPEWKSPEQVCAATGGVRNVTLRLDSRLQCELLVNGQPVQRQEWLHDLSRHQVQVEGRGARVRGRWLRPQPVEVAVQVRPEARHQTIIGFGGITPPPAYASLSEEGKRRWWELLSEYNLLIQREYPNGTRLNRAMDNWDKLADATPHYYGDNFPNGEISDFAYNRRIQELGGEVWFEFWRTPPWVGTNVQRYAEAMVNYCQTAQQRAGRPPAVVGIQNEVRQKPEVWHARVVALRRALDAAGFAQVRIHMADATDLKGGIKFIRDFRRSPEAWASINFTACHMYDFQDYFTQPDAYDARLLEWHALGDGKPFLSTELCVNREQYQTDSYRMALAMGQLYHKNLTLADAVAVCYCWTLLNVVQPSYGATRSLFVPDERHGLVPVPSSHQLRTFGAYSRRIHQGMTRLAVESGDPDLLVTAFAGADGRTTLVALNRSSRSITVKLNWPSAEFSTLEVADSYHQNSVRPLASGSSEFTVAPGAIVTLTSVKLKSLSPASP
jgi:O-glycosyl hydrolase